MGILKRSCWLTAAIMMIASAADAMPLPGYTLIWQDDFREAALDSSKWKPETYKRGAAQLAANAISTGADGLRIHSYTENGINYTGFLISKYLVTYGYFESRIRFRDAPGEHCAFWLQSEKLGKIIGNAAQAGVETDIVEHRVSDKKGADISNMAAFNLHWDGYGKDHKTVGSKWLAPASLNNTWHTYGLLWTPGIYVFYVDDVARWQSNAAVSHVPQEVRLTCEMVGPVSWSGTIPQGGYGPYATSPYGMDVDWVRVWQKTN